MKKTTEKTETTELVSAQVAETATTEKKVTPRSSEQDVQNMRKSMNLLTSVIEFNDEVNKLLQNSPFWNTENENERLSARKVIGELYNEVDLAEAKEILHGMSRIEVNLNSMSSYYGRKTVSTKTTTIKIGGEFYKISSSKLEEIKNSGENPAIVKAALLEAATKIENVIEEF